MANPKNAYLARQQAQKDAFMHGVERIIKQWMIDTLCITLNQTEGRGYDRIMRLLEDWHKTREEFRSALNPLQDAEADVAQEHIERILKQIAGDNGQFYPWETRYPDLRRVKYRG